jgi:hypothetical protein
MVAKCYVELRKSSARGTDSVIADTMRHLHTRQHLGKTVIVCEQPLALLSSARKQWLKLSRSLQKQRASTLNAEKILKYTHTITRMQRMHFSAKTPLEQPDADVYFLSPDKTEVMPVHCWSVYMLCPVPARIAKVVLAQLPSEALIIDYCQSKTWQNLGSQPKKALEERVANEWRQVQQFLRGYHIDVTKLIIDDVHDIEAMDDALDILLGGVSHRFLQVANEFQRALELARPLRLSKRARSSYDALVLLAHRVQALNPGAFSQHFLETYNEDDTFFLYDPNRVRKQITGSETLAEAFARHARAGRTNLARSLQALAEGVH